MTAPVTLSLIEARPYDRPRLPRRAELRMLEQAFADARAPVILDARGPSDFEAFVERLKSGAAILHFDGHGYRNSHDGDYYLVFERRRNGLEQPVKLSSMLNAIREYRSPSQPLLLCLSSCGAMAQQERSEAAACDALAALVAFDQPIQANIATEFFRVFYSRLADGVSIGDAFIQATSGLDGPFCQLGAHQPRWFSDRAITSVPLDIRVDAGSSIIGPDLHDAARTLRRTQSKLHQHLVRDDREQNDIVVVGPQDSGRTSMVKSVLQHVAWRFDAAVSVEVDPRQGPMSADALATAILRRVPSELRNHELSAPAEALRALLEPTRGRGLALFVQGIEERSNLTADAWQLLRRVEAPSATLVVGTHRALDPHGTATFRVSPLTANEARSFFISCLAVEEAQFVTVVEHINHSFDRIYQRIGGYPLALHSAAKRVHSADDVDALAQTPPPPSSERWLHRAINTVRTDDQWARAMSLMALFYGNVPDEQARRIVEDPRGSVLRDLVDNGFLGRGQLVLDAVSRATVRAYTLHSTLRRALLSAQLTRADDQLRGFVVSRPKATVAGNWNTTWRDSLLSWAASLNDHDIKELRAAGALSSMLRLVSETFDEALSVCERQWRYGMAAEHQLRWSSLLELCGEQPRAADRRLASVRSFIRAGRFEEAEYRAAEIQAPDYDQEVCTYALVLRGDAARRRGRADDAEQLYSEALGYAQQGSDANGQAAAARGLSDVARERGDFARALELLAQVRRAKRAIGREWEALEREAYVHQLLRHDGRALWLYDQTIALCPEPDDPTPIRSMINSADVLTNSRDFANALAVFEEAIARAHSINNDLLAAEALSRLARSHARAFNPDGVADAITRGRELSRRRNIPTGYRALRFRVELAEAAAMVGQLEEARRLLRSLTQPGFNRLVGPMVAGMLTRANALVFKHDGLNGEERHESAAHSLQRAAAEFARAAASYRDTGRNWRAVRCELQRAECVRLAIEARPSVRQHQLEELEQDLVVICAELAAMRDRLRTGYALKQLADVRRALGRGHTASRLAELGIKLHQELAQHRDSGELPERVALPRL